MVKFRIDKLTCLLIVLTFVMLGVNTMAFDGEAQAVVATIHDLTQLEPETELLVYVSGYHREGDGGEGFFVFDPVNTEPVDGGMVIGALGYEEKGRWLRQIDEPIINILWYGAQSGSYSSQSQYLQGAIDYLFDRKMTGTVLIPAGVYYIDKSLPFYQGVSIQGEGIDVSILRNTAHIGTMVPAPLHHSSENKLDLTWSDFTLDVNMYNVGSTIHGFRISSYFSGLTIERLRMTNFHGNEMRMAMDSVIRDSIFDNLSGNMLYTGGPEGSSYGFKNNQIINNVFIKTSENPEGPGINLSRALNSEVIGNKVISLHPPADTYGGIRIPNDSDHNLVKDNLVMNFSRGIWALSGSDSNLIEGNTVIDSWIQPLFINRSHAGVPPVEYNHMLNNTVIQINPQISHRELIRIHGDNSPNIVRYNIIEGNEVILTRAHYDNFMRGKPEDQIRDGIVWLTGSAQNPGQSTVKDNFVTIIEKPFYIKVDNIEDYTIYGKSFTPEIRVVDASQKEIDLDHVEIRMQLNDREYNGEAITKPGVYHLAIEADWEGGTTYGHKFFQLVGPVTISGQFVDVEGNPFTNLELEISGADTNQVITVNDPQGYWGTEIIGEVTITPYHYDYRFSPSSITTALFRTDLNFTAQEFDSYSVSGMVVDEFADPLSGIEIRVTGDREMLVAVDEQGLFSISKIYGDNWIIPEMEGHYFSPQRYIVSETTRNMDQMYFKGAGDPRLILHYSFDEIEGRTVIDSSIFEHNGNIIGLYQTTEGPSGGQALAFSGMLNNVTLPNDLLYGLGDFTIAFWVKYESASDSAILFDFGENGESSFWLAPYRTGTTLQILGDRDDRSSYLVVEQSQSLRPNNWQHLAITRSGTTASIYINGKKVYFVGSDQVSAQKFGFTTRNYLGRSNYMHTHGDPWFAGAMDDFRIYNYALGAEEIANLANNVD